MLVGEAMKKEDYKKVSHRKFLQGIEQLCNHLLDYIHKNEIQIDYICPILRSGAVPAVYIANRLNIVKFFPMQVKHIAYKNNNKIEMIFNPFNSVVIKKKELVFLVVDSMSSTGTSAEICINEIKNRYKGAKILYVSLYKEYGSKDLSSITSYEDTIFYYNGSNKFSQSKCKKLNIEYYHPLFSWEILEMELEHPDDLEENIFF